MAFKLADDVLRQGVNGISELLTETGLINVDFAHIRRVMSLGGGALMAIGTGEGEDKAFKALQQALHHPMLDDISLDSSAGIIANFTGGDDLTFAEVADTLNYLHQETGNQAEIIPGVISDPNLNNRAQVILIITGLGALPIEQVIPGAEKYLAELAALEPTPQPKDQITPKPVREPRDQKPTSQDSYSLSEARPAMMSTDLDVPAFLRKRIK
jgi:cell division protein FtsZ